MKKIFSLVIALMAVMSINATDYYISGIGGWAEPGSNAAMLLVPAAGTSVRTVSFARIDEGSEFKVFANTGWGGPEYGAAAAGEAVTANGAAYTMASPAQNLKIAMEAGHYLTDAVVSVDTANWTVTVTGTDVNGNLEPTVYCLVGGCTNNWNTADAIEFVEEAGVLTATIPDLNGTFKIIKNHKWGWEAAAASATDKLGFNVPMTLVTAGGENIAMANPFGAYQNAKITLDVTNEDAPVITLIAGDLQVFQANWYFPGSKIGWNLNETTQFQPVAGKENTYEFLAPEFEKDFKVVYGSNWEVEFGGMKGGDTLRWEVNKPIELFSPAANVYAASETVYTDVTITITVDYQAGSVQILLSPEGSAVENVATEQKAVKFIENGQIVIIKDGVRYNVLGAKL